MVEAISKKNFLGPFKNKMQTVLEKVKGPHFISNLLMKKIPGSLHSQKCKNW